MGIRNFRTMKEKSKEIDDQVLVRYLKRLFFYPFYIGDKLLMFWKVTETPSFMDWLNKNPKYTQVAKMKKSGFNQSYRYGSMVRVTAFIVGWFVFRWIF